MAQSLLVAESLVHDGVLAAVRESRYAQWDGGLGRLMQAEGATLDSIAEEATRSNLDPRPVSGRQELLENEVNRVIWATT